MKAGILLRFTLRSLRRNRTRSIVSIVGIVLSTALITAVFATVTSLEAAMEKATSLTEGGWSVYAIREGTDDFAGLLSNEHAQAAATSSELGEARIVDETNRLGSWFALRTLPKGRLGPDGEAKTLVTPLKLTEGRLPQAAGEVLLPSSMRGVSLSSGGVRSDGKLQLGTRLDVDLGQRVRNGEPISSLSDSVRHATSDEPVAGGDAGSDNDVIEGAQTQSLTVVGYYDRHYASIGNSMFASFEDQVGITSADAAGTPTASCVWASTKGFSSLDDLKAWTHETLGEDGSYLHNNLLRYQGVYGTGVVWQALWNMAATLAAIIAVASISLIYNAFAISVAERTRQFGLLSSIGASRHQLRRTVFGEALVLGLMGIPLGILVGLAGVAVTLSLNQEGFAALLNMEGIMSLHVSPAAIALTVLFSLVVLVASAWAPALRAGCVSAIDAIRQSQDVRVSPSLVRKLGKGGRGEGRMSAPRLLARRNLSRTRSRGRVIVASLAMSVALMVTGGYLAQTVRTIVTGGNYEGMRSVDLSASYNGYSEGGVLSQAQDFQEGSKAVVDAANQLTDVSNVRSYTSCWASGMLPNGSIDTSIQRNQDGTLGSYSVSDMGAAAGTVNLVIPDAASWRRIAEAAGVDETSDAIALNSYRIHNDDGSVTYTRPLVAKGDLTLVLAESRGEASSSLLSMDADGTPLVRYCTEGGTDDTTATEQSVPLDELSSQQRTLHVAALLDKLPDDLEWMASPDNFPTYLVSPCLKDNLADVIYPSSTIVGMQAKDSTRSMDELEAALPKYSDAMHFMDIASETRNTRLALETMTLFCLLFSLIMVLIAVANVFNTLSNSMLLRTREFAMLKSVGMGQGAFRKMVVYECASYALRGLGWGLALSLTISFLLYRSTELVSRGAGFELPWASMGAACLISAAVLGVSVVFALHKGHTSNVVEALRTDAA